MLPSDYKWIRLPKSTLIIRINASFFSLTLRWWPAARSRGERRVRKQKALIHTVVSNMTKKGEPFVSMSWFAVTLQSFHSTDNARVGASSSGEMWMLSGTFKILWWKTIAIAHDWPIDNPQSSTKKITIIWASLTFALLSITAITLIRIQGLAEAPACTTASGQHLVWVPCGIR